MATTTTNYGLTKPAQTDYYNVGVANDNNDKIDQVLKAHEDEIGGKLSGNGDASNLTVSFTAATTRALPATGEAVKVLIGKILKWLGDLGTAAFSAATDFAAAMHKHSKADITDFPSAMTPTVHAASHSKTGTDPVTPEAIGASTSFKATGTLTTAGWTGSAAPYTQDLTVAGVLETDVPRVNPVLGTDSAARDLIKTAWQLATTSSNPPYAYDGKISFYAASKPTTNIPVVVSVVRP